MTINADTYGSSLLELLGIENVFADAGERYPETTLEEIAERHADLVLLPGEPYPFKDRHVGEVETVVRGADVRLVDGRDLFWWGIRTPDARRRGSARRSDVREPGAVLLAVGRAVEVHEVLLVARELGSAHRRIRVRACPGFERDRDVADRVWRRSARRRRRARRA